MANWLYSFVYCDKSCPSQKGITRSHRDGRGKGEINMKKYDKIKGKGIVLDKFKHKRWGDYR